MNIIKPITKQWSSIKFQIDLQGPVVRKPINLIQD